jgi:hypothetical protein
LIFCAWAEANFSKVIHTPYGFELDEINQIKRAAAEREISMGWMKAVKVGVRHLPAQRGSFAPNAVLLLARAIKKWVFEPSILRNKIAHGQWKIALNCKNDALQNDITGDLMGLTVTQIDGWFSCHEQLARLVEMLIVSPEKSFQRDWYTTVSELEQRMREASSRKVEEHRSILERKLLQTHVPEISNQKRSDI